MVQKISKINKFKKSFTLLEVSIVLAVLAILASSVVSGAHLINTARSNAIIQEINNYRQAINEFYSSHEYNLPGDYYRAQEELAPSGYTTSSLTTISTIQSKSTIDRIPISGDGDGAILSQIIGSETTIFYSEAFGVWSHLSKTGYMDKNYSNTCYNIRSQARSECLKAGYNLPIIKNGRDNAVYTFYKPNISNSADLNLLGVTRDDFDFNSHILLMSDITEGSISTTNIGSYAIGAGGAISAQLMRNIDIKIDDGMPLKGNVFGVNGNRLEDKCSNYTGSNSSFYSSTLTKDTTIYNKDNDKYCIGVIVINEFR